MSSVRRLVGEGALRLKGVSGGYGPRDLVSELTLKVRSGERVAVLGPNGAGKTTLFDLIAGRLGVRSGRIVLGRDDVTALPLHRRARLGLGYVPQEASVFGELSVVDNLRAALGSPAASRSGVGDLDSSLSEWCLEGLADRRAALLSGGERRRVEIARALLVRPSLLMLDEPFSGLDPRGRNVLGDCLRRLPDHVSLLATDHSAEDLLALCDRVVLLVDGQVQFDGTTTAFQSGDPAHRRYFG